MAINQEIISTSWEGQQKSFIEAGLKTLLQRMLEVLESPLAANSVGSNQLTQELRDVINSIGSKVPNTRTVNRQPLNADVTIGPGDIMVGNQTLADKLDDMDEAIGQGGDTSGLATRIAALESSLNTLTGANDSTQIIDTFNEVIDFLNNVYNDETLLGKLQQLQTQINSKANDNAVVKSISVNGAAQSKDQNGNVNISVQGQDGKSAYQVAVDNGFIGSQAEWLASLNGNDGVENGDDVVVVNNYNGVPSDIQPGQVAVLGAALGMSIGKVFNVNTQDQNNATPYRLWIGTQQQLEALNEDYEDNTIYLVGIIPTVSQRFNVTFNGGDHTSIPASTPETVKEGSAFSVIVSPASGYTIDTVAVTMGSTDITSTAYNSSTGVVNIASVTGNITITATASIHITSITITADQQDGNSIDLHATVSPNNAENVTLAWSLPSGTTKFSISGSGTSATLTLLSGATTSDSVVVTCADTNAASDTASGTLTVTPTSDYNDSVPITEITDITATRTAANTLTLEATADGNTPSPTFSLVGTVPTVKQVRRWSAGDEVDGETQDEAGSDLIDVPAVVLSGNTLTYKDDCQVTLKATAGSVESDEKTINITHDSADAIWFEDDVVKGLLLTAGWGSNGEITYTQAAASVGTQTNNQAVFKNNTTIIRFNEWKWFTNSQFNVSGCSSLESIKLPKISVTSEFDSRFGINGTALTQVEIPSGYTAYGGISTNWSISPIQGTKITSISLPASIRSILVGFTSLSKITEIDLSTTSASSLPSSKPTFSGSSDVLPKLKTIKFPDTLTSITYSQTIRECKALSRIEFGTGFTNASTYIYDGAFGDSVAMTYVFHSTTPPTAFAFESNKSGRRTVNKILVPRAAVDTYKASSVFASHIDKISAIEDEEV